jgi:hypothetical protein
VGKRSRGGASGAREGWTISRNLTCRSVLICDRLQAKPTFASITRRLPAKVFFEFPVTDSKNKVRAETAGSRLMACASDGVFADAFTFCRAFMFSRHAFLR